MEACTEVGGRIFTLGAVFIPRVLAERWEEPSRAGRGFRWWLRASGEPGMGVKT